MPAWREVLPAPSCALMGTVPPHWPSACSHTGTAPRCCTDPTPGQGHSPTARGHGGITVPGQWLPGGTKVTGVPVPPSSAQPCACAGVAQPLASFQGLRWTSQPRGSNTTVLMVAPGDPQGWLCVWHQGDHPLSLHPCVPTSPRTRQGAATGKPSCSNVVPALPGLRGRWAPTGAGVADGSQPRPSSGAARSPLQQPAHKEGTQVRPDLTGMSLWVQSCVVVTCGQGMCQGGRLTADRMATCGLSWGQAAGSSLQRMTAGTWDRSSARGWGQGNQTELLWQRQRVRRVWGASCPVAG